jgi:uncharacterized protein (TIGR03086 family)
MVGPAERHRRYAGAFTELVRGTRDWETPAPVEGWTARDVVGHLVEWFPGFLRGGCDVELPAGPPVAEDPVTAWQIQFDAVQALLDDPATPTRSFDNRHTGSLPLDQAVDRFYTADVFMHSWDLARATGQDLTLDPDFAEELLEGSKPIEQLMRDSGQYGPAVPVPDDAPVVDRLIGFIGRDPAWQPPPLTRPARSSPR